MSRPWNRGRAVDDDPRRGLAALRQFQVVSAANAVPGAGGPVEVAAIAAGNGNAIDDGGDLASEREGVDGGAGQLHAEAVSDFSGDEDSDTGNSGGEEAREEQVDHEIVSLYTRHNITMEAMEDVMKLLRVQEVHLTGRESALPNFRALKERSLKKIPGIFIDYEFKDRQRGQIEKRTRQKKMARMHRDDADRFEFCFALTYVAVKDVVAFHSECNPNHEIGEVILCADNVPSDSSNQRSFDIVSLQFNGCHAIYPLRIFLPEKGVKFNVQKNLQEVLREIQECGLILAAVVCDLIKKASLVGLTQCGGYYSCLQCEIPGEYSQIAQTMTYGFGEVWPQRTHESFLQVTARPDFNILRENVREHGETLRGIKERSVLLDHPHFDIVKQVPIDVMHNAYLGVVLKTFHRTFQTGSDTIRGMGRRPRLAIEAFDAIYPLQKVPSEHKRRTRKFCRFWKASELKALILFHAPVLLQLLQDHPDENHALLRDVWALMAYILKAATLPEQEYLLANVDREHVMNQFGQACQNYFGRDLIFYNLHLFTHIFGVREDHGSLERVSAFRSENMYQLFLRCYQAGTASTGKQGLQNVYLHYRHNHTCKTKLHFSNKETSKTQDNYVYVTGHEVYKVLHVSADCIHLDCVRVQLNPYNYQTSNGENLNFGLLGVFGPGPAITGERRQLTVAQVLGKAICSSLYTVCIPRETLLDGAF